MSVLSAMIKGKKLYNVKTGKTETSMGVANATSANPAKPDTKISNISKISSSNDPRRQQGEAAFSVANLPIWCSRSCSALSKLSVPTGDLYVCMTENKTLVSWTNLSFMNGCPKKIGLAAFNDEGWPEWF